MKKNLPITDNEVPFPLGEEIISTTDLKGIITSFNSTFLEISGFEEHELMHKNHNVIRHPDMPVEAFADLWDHMKQNKHWMGIVKNRCKNGDYYWVDAYVTPMLENEQVIGYESVRAKPSPERVARAEKIYKQVRDGKKAQLGSFFDRLCLKCRANLLNVSAVLLGAGAYSLTPEMMSGLPITVAAVTVLAVFAAGSKWAFAPLEQAVKTVHKDINNPLMALIYTGRSDEIGQIQLPAQLLKAKLRTVLGRIRDVVDKIEGSAAESVNALGEINDAVKFQASETDMVATAMTEMTASVQEVANSAAYAAGKAEDVDNHSQEGVSHASGAAGGLQGLNTAVENISNVVSRLNDDTQNIGVVVDVIRNIAEQTNLLALNAAIEAARAGEQGRGFAVVADEVRTLAGRTQESTQEIQTLIENLNEAVTHAVAVVEDSQRAALESEEKVTNAIESLGLIAEQVSDMNDLNTQIATAVEEQSSVSTDMNKNIVQIRDGAEHVLTAAGSINSAANDLSQEAYDLSNMIKRFQQA